MEKLLLVAGFIVMSMSFVAISFFEFPAIPFSGQRSQQQAQVSCSFRDFSYGEGEGAFEFVLDSVGADGRDWNYVRNLTDWYYLPISHSDIHNPVVDDYVEKALRQPVEEGMHHFFVDYRGKISDNLAQQLKDNNVGLVQLHLDSLDEVEPLSIGLDMVRQLSPETGIIVRIDANDISDVKGKKAELLGHNLDFDYFGFTYREGEDWGEYDKALLEMGKMGKPAVVDVTIAAGGLSVQAEHTRQFLFYTLGRKDVKAVIFHSLKGDGRLLDAAPRPAYQEVFRFAEEKKFSPVYYIPKECS